MASEFLTKPLISSIAPTLRKQRAEFSLAPGFSEGSPALKHGANKNAEKEFITLIYDDYLDAVSDLRPARNTLPRLEAKNLVSELPAKKVSNFFQLPV